MTDTPVGLPGDIDAWEDGEPPGHLGPQGVGEFSVGPHLPAISHGVGAESWSRVRGSHGGAD